MSSVIVKSILRKFESNLWGYHFHISPQVAQNLIEGNNRRIVCIVNESLKIQSALMPYSEGYFIFMNKSNVDKLNIAEDDEVELEISKDNSEYGLPMPESFQMLLEQDEKGSKYFHQLTIGKQRSLIYIVGKVKNIDSQLNKGLAILHHLKEKQGNLNFKQLTAMIKTYNQRAKLK